MYFTDYSQTYESTLRGDDYHAQEVNNRITERTEELPSKIIGNDQKVSFQERGGNSYVRSGGLLQSSEFMIIGDETINGQPTTLSLKSYNGIPGLYRVSEDGTHVKLI